MPVLNSKKREIDIKIVYYGPGLSGKTTNLQHLYSLLDTSCRGKFISLATESDRTLFFDFLPVELGKIKDFSVRFQLYTVPGQIRYNATRKLVLKGADAVVFVGDSQRDMREQNRESFENMKENLLSNNLDPDEIPIVIQYNKRDLPNILSKEELRSDLNSRNYEEIEAVAVKDEGVLETFRLISKILLKNISQKHKMDVEVPPSRESPTSVKIPEREGEEEEVIVDAVLPQQAFERETIFVTPPQPARSPESVSAEEKLNPMVKASLGEINRSLAEINETLFRLSAEMRESGRQQTEMMRMLRDMYTSLIRGKGKRRWFHFSSK